VNIGIYYIFSDREHQFRCPEAQGETFILAHPWARVDLCGKQLNKYVMCTEKNDSKRNISTIVFIPLFWRYKNNEYIQS